MTYTVTGTAGTQARKTRQAMFAMSNSCLKCATPFDPFAEPGAPDSMHIDHVVPRSKGGPDHLSNYQPLCSPCNTSKGNRSSADYRSAEQKALYPVPAEIRRRREEAKRKAEAEAAAKAARDEAERAALAEQRARAAAFYNSPAEVAKRAAESARQDERDRQEKQRHLEQLRQEFQSAARSLLISFVVLLGLIAALLLFINTRDFTADQGGADLTGVPVSVFSAPGGHHGQHHGV